MNEAVKDVFSKSDEFGQQYAAARIIELEQENSRLREENEKLRGRLDSWQERTFAAQAQTEEVLKAKQKLNQKLHLAHLQIGRELT